MRIGAFALRALIAMAILVGATPAHAQFYEQHNLVSDGAVPADHVDSLLVNPWGLVSSSASPWWVADNGTGTSTLYDGNGVKQALNVSVPGSPTGIVFNPTSGFVIPSHGTARFIFASEDGTISAWSGGTKAFVVVDRSATGAVFKGLAFAQTAAGAFIYATDFHNGTVDVFDSTFAPVATGGFIDPAIPTGYAPFGIRTLNGTIFVTYALQDEKAHDDVPGEGHGFVNAFDTAGHFLQRVASQGDLNSPWGLALAPAGFGKFSGDLLVGNFGDGRIHAFDPNDLTAAGEFEDHGPLHSTSGRPIEIDGLWALAFGNGGRAGPTTTLFFTAGPFGEADGVFGRLTVAPPPGRN
jgi:uncharacterized protein (TIGR03118 family)